MQRRLSAILVADIVGYSRLMEQDEAVTLARQKVHRSDVIDPAVNKAGGRIFKTTGDGLLVDFTSVVEALSCAISLQRAIGLRESDVPDDRKIVYRVGIHLGDVVHENDDVHGDGVNIAARLEQMADPGGICISGSAFEHIRSHNDVGFRDLGEVQVKNISRPIRAWRVLLDPEQAGKIVRAPVRPRLSPMAVALAFCALTLFAGGFWWWQSQPDFTPADPDKYAFELPEKPSIAVLAFDNLSGDAQNEFIGDALSENIIARLAENPKIFVIARNSSFHYKGTATPVQSIAEELGVRYILEGSIQRSGENIRATTQLIDALGGQHVWAKTYDRALTTSDLFAIQDDITKDISLSMQAELVTGSYARSDVEDLGDLETLKLVNQAVAEFQKFTQDGNQRSEDLLLRAMEHNPNSSLVHVNLGWATWYKLPLGQSKDPAATMAKARHYAEKAVEINPQSAYAYALLGWLDMYGLDHAAAITNAKQAVELSPGGGIATSVAGWVLSASGNPARGAELLRYGMRTEVFYPDWIPNSLAMSLMMLGQYDEAKVLLTTLEAEANPSIRRWARNNLTIIAVWQGDIELARKLADQTLKENPGYSVAQQVRYVYQISDKGHIDKMLNALRMAGVPENPPSVPARNN